MAIMEAVLFGVLLSLVIIVKDIFSPSSGYNPGFESICPGFGGAFAKDFNEKITLLK